MPNYQFGELPGIQEGANFANRAALREAGVHLAPVAGIDGNGKDGCPSIVLNGGYIDDFDEGDIILYTGHGGNDPSSGKQIKDQSWDAPGNKALLTSELQGLPVRVTRGFNHKSEFSPKTGYKYGGTYSIVEHFEEVGKNGFKICRYKLIKNTESLHGKLSDSEVTFSEGSDGKKRIETTTLRIVRDTKLSRQIKELYDYTCQICGLRIESHGIGYAEGAHIRPLGKPHNGTDTADNLLCLCPNHHVMFDKGIFAVDSNLLLTGIIGKLNLNKNHIVNLSNLEYHRIHVYGASKN